ncbi:hypothetical protein M409DRAFT_66055 [Zasmidium cellare ATCC 36951]|uniref:Zn(2)-C6 fungal-type domain-containing protein n=1 Tax=Zasmidium cellare ATCC 36951 TaxID=1080233 RepID=A0A6A6CJV7_ZASCE|nr:uncharacterized protein M409DRAFT_66055 [Zasmidium cellare ATCC 36951]KAF2167517.1 hypothetical protein M409DRAFT_66055 [Zasmidium cellare ATCC 36951]
MDESIVVRGQKRTERRAKSKTGCGTCKIRRIKCDESKPSCNKCVSTGRKCDGYESPFRSFIPELGSRGTGQQDDIEQANVGTRAVLPAEVEILSRLFSTKTMFDVNLGCEEESKQVLHASLTQAPLRSAIASLKVLREDLESSLSNSPSSPWRPETNHEGLQQYSKAMTGLAKSLSLPDRTRVPSTLLCCETFISIEQVRGDHVAMAQHIIRGVEIMREYGARPCLTHAGKLVPAHRGPLPLIDVFAVKLFAAPCRFKEQPAVVGAHGGTAATCDDQRLDPENQKQLKNLATNTLVFLNEVRHVQSVEDATQLVSKKANLLKSLNDWLLDLNQIQRQGEPIDKEPLAVLFERVFHQLLRIFTLNALDSSQSQDVQIAAEKRQLLELAGIVSSRVQAYNAGWSAGSVFGGERQTVGV